jgi:hypothetical protein
MTDHVRWQTLAARRIDAGLSPADASALAEHQGACAECRAFSLALGADARALATLEFGLAPARLRVRVAEGTAAIGSSRPSLGALLIAAVLLALAVVAGSAAVGALLNQRPTLPGLERPDIRWTTEVVDLQAIDFWIETAGKRFRGTTPMTVRSDPGDATQRTLELTWHEHGAEMRLNIYVGGDGTHWWINEITTYDGTRGSPDWLYYEVPDVRAPLGQAWTGSVDVRSVKASQPGRGPGRLHFGTVQLATIASDLVNVPPGGGIVIKENADPFGPGGPLHCTDILQLTPKEAEAVLLRLGYRLSWRLQWSTGPNSGYSEPHKTAPDGRIAGTAVGTSGELIVFVQDPTRPMGGAPAAFPADCPQPGNAPTPAP